MAGTTEVRTFVATCPVGVTSAAPLVIDLPMPDRTILHIRIRVPPGPNGELGFAVGSQATGILPSPENPWFIANDEVYEYSLADLPDSGNWQCIMYNTGQYPHSVYVTFTCQVPDQPVSTPLTSAAVVSQLAAPAVVADAITPSALPTS